MNIRYLGTVIFKRESGEEVVGNILPASTLRYKQLEQVEREQREFLKENPNKSIMELDKKKIRDFAKRTAKIILDFEGGFPKDEFFEADDFEFSSLEVAKGAFFLTFKNPFSFVVK